MMAAQPKIIQGGMGVQVSSANDWPKRNVPTESICAGMGARGHGREAVILGQNS
jgi:hypothetical protein